MAGCVRGHARELQGADRRDSHRPAGLPASQNGTDRHESRADAQFATGIADIGAGRQGNRRCVCQPTRGATYRQSTAGHQRSDREITIMSTGNLILDRQLARWYPLIDHSVQLDLVKQATGGQPGVFRGASGETTPSAGQTSTSRIGMSGTSGGGPSGGRGGA